jgi:Alpha/beta hydrolase family
MTLSQLQLWRKAVPFFITFFCLLPWFLVRQDSFTQAQMPYTITVLAVGLVAPFLYVVLKLRDPRWKREMAEYVGAQIRNSLITLIPQDLQLSTTEREQLANSEIYKELTGVFWEAIDQSDVLRAQKEHFYSNGIEYSTAIDVFHLARFFGLCYLTASIIFGEVSLFLVGAFLASVAMIARWFAIPRARRHHLALSAEQLDLLRREKGDFVADRFRQIVAGWRGTHHFGQPGVQAPRSHRLALWDFSIVLFVLVAGVIGVVSRGWFGRDSLARSAAEVKSSYITKGAHNKAIVVVFVHGIFGTKEDTWLSPAGSGSFPELLATDAEEKDKVDVFAFEYFTPKFGPAPSIVDLADQLRGELDDQHVFEDHQKVVFLAHSMGGIVVRQFLLSNPDRMLKVPMVFFYATPTNGSDLASIGRLASASPQLRGMVPIEGNDFLQSIQSGWLNSDRAKSIASYCGVEELPTFGVMVVTRSSATSLCNRGLDPFSTDHLEIVKPTSRSDPRYTRFVTALQKEVLGIDAQPANQSSFSPSGNVDAKIHGAKSVEITRVPKAVNVPNPITTKKPDIKKSFANPGPLAPKGKSGNGSPPVAVLANVEDNVVYEITTISDVIGSDGHLTDKHIRRYLIRATVRLQNRSQVRQDLVDGSITMNCQSRQIKKPESLRFVLNPVPSVRLEGTKSDDVEFSFQGAGGSSGAFPLEEPPPPPAVCSEMRIKLRFLSENAEEHVLMVSVPDTVFGVGPKEQ